MDGNSESIGEEEGFFDGIDTSITGMFTLFDENVSAMARGRLKLIEGARELAFSSYDVADPSAVIGPLTDGLKLTRELIASLDEGSDSWFVLSVKEKQFEDAIHAALGVHLVATAVPLGTPIAMRPWEPLPTLSAVVPGQKYEVQVNVLNPSSESIDNLDLKLHSSAGLIAENKSLPQVQLFNNMSLQVDFEVEVPEDARYSETYFSRSSIFENRYQLTDPALVHTQRGAPAQEAVLSYEVLGVPLQLSETVHARKAVLPDGYELNELRVYCPSCRQIFHRAEVSFANVQKYIHSSIGIIII